METKDEILKEIQNLQKELLQTDKELKYCKDEKLKKILNEEKKQIQLDLEDATASLKTINDVVESDGDLEQPPKEPQDPRMETYEIDKTEPENEI